MYTEYLREHFMPLEEFLLPLFFSYSLIYLGTNLLPKLSPIGIWVLIERVIVLEKHVTARKGW